MENQERHNKKIELLSKCIDAKIITLQDALMLLDADIVPEAEESTTTISPGTTWQAPTHFPNLVPYCQPVSGTATIMGSAVLTTTSTSGSNTTTTTYPGSAITYTNTVGSNTESLAKHKE